MTKTNSFFKFDESEMFKTIEKIVAQVLTQKMGDLQPEMNISALGDLIPQEEVMKILGRKTTWFYNMRKRGALKGIKSANKWWYKKEDIINFIERGGTASDLHK